MGNVLEKVVDASAEYFPSIHCRLTITADDKKTVRKAADDVAASPEVVIGRLEGGVEKFLERNETPDGRPGAVVQLWGQEFPGKPFDESLVKLATELSYNIRQRVLVKPFTAVFDSLENPDGKIDISDRIGHCGDGWEYIKKQYNRNMIVVPIMVPDFKIEKTLGYSRKGVMGAGIWAGCTSKKAVKQVEVGTLEAIKEVDGVVTPFDVCSAGSKPGGKFKYIGPTINEEYCPSLVERLKKGGMTSKVPKRVKYIPELVIDADTMDAAKKALKVGIEKLYNTPGVEWISPANFGGKLGQYQINFHDLFK
jgi:formylmethanofuran--tetrahydromethanopterin N-formyltransferase